MTKINCCCGSEKYFEDYCEPYIRGIQGAPIAKALMRSRYTAYATQAVNYLVATTPLSRCQFYSKKDILKWTISNT